jgi:hypothetical protein
MPAAATYVPVRCYRPTSSRVVTGATPFLNRDDTGGCDNGSGSTTPRKDQTMSSTRVVGSAAALIATLFMPTAQATAEAPTPEEQIRACIAPIADPPRSPDVLQGWIDGCRARGDFS